MLPHRENLRLEGAFVFWGEVAEQMIIDQFSFDLKQTIGINVAIED